MSYLLYGKRQSASVTIESLLSEARVTWENSKWCQTHCPRVEKILQLIRDVISRDIPEMLGFGGPQSSSQQGEFYHASSVYE